MGEFVMPSLGSQMIKARLVKWHVKPGDQVEKGDIIGEIDTEKGLIDIEVFEDGTIEELVAKEGDTLEVGAVMAVIESKNGKKPGTDKPKAPQKKSKAASENGEKKQPRRSEKAEKKTGVKASPLAKRVADDLQVDIRRVPGSGHGGTIHKKDVETYAERQQADETFEKELEMAEHLSEAGKPGMRSAIAGAMSRSNREIPHYYVETDIDMKRAMDWLGQYNRLHPLKERLMPPILLVKAVANALAEWPQLNGFWSDEAMHIEDGIHVGFAISLRSGGLVIPAVMNADLKSMEEIRSDFLDLVTRAREGHLRSREISSATITVTSLGERGADRVYGVIYPPQVALVGFGSIVERPWAVDGSIGIRPVLTATLAGDHRATDGHTGSRFLETLNEQLQHPEEI
ncbi:MAG: dihydrolipoamide acetyltransferase family protein [Balneolaceae bacterium]|nr:dihydrolipoamide acetyltransferase family protein [Balneolaceae bacterium]